MVIQFVTLIIGKDWAKVSRVRFSDAAPVANIKMLENITLKELAGSKTISVEFYSQRPEGALAWNYDYKTT